MKSNEAGINPLKVLKVTEISSSSGDFLAKNKV